MILMFFGTKILFIFLFELIIWNSNWNFTEKSEYIFILTWYFSSRKHLNSQTLISCSNSLAANIVVNSATLTIF